MSLKEMSKERINEISMIDLATIILKEKREAIDFNDMFAQIASIKGFTEEQKEVNIAQFYTDMNIDGSFMTTGTNKWGLKQWFPIEQMEEDIANLPQKRKKKKKKPSKLLEDELGVSDEDATSDDDLDEVDLDLTDEDLDLDEDDFAEEVDEEEEVTKGDKK